MESLQDKAAERAAQAAFVNSIRPEGAKLRSQVSSMPSVFAVLVRLRQACTHSSLLPPELRLGQPTGDDSSEETQGSTGDADGNHHSAEDSQNSTEGSTGYTEGSQKTTKGRAGEPEGNQGKAKGKQLPQSLATTIDGIQTKRGQSTKTKRVMRIVKVRYRCSVRFKSCHGYRVMWCVAFFGYNCSCSCHGMPSLLCKADSVISMFCIMLPSILMLPGCPVLC